MKTSNKIRIAILSVLLFNFIGFSQITSKENKSDNLDKNQIDRAIEENKKSKLKYNKVGENWNTFYHLERNCYNDNYNDLIILMNSRMGIKKTKKLNEKKHFNKVSYKPVVSYMSGEISNSKSENYFHVIETPKNQVNIKNRSRIDDFQFVIATQLDKLLLVKDNLILEKINLNRVNGTSTFTGMTSEGETINIAPIPCKM